MPEDSIKYNFKNKSLLNHALTHPSAKKSKKISDYERLEFLGDSILGFIVSEILYKKFPEEKEGSLAKRRAAIVCRNSLAKVAKQIKLGDYLILSNGEEQTGGRENNANLENALEALIAAIYLDGGMAKTKAFIKEHFSEMLGDIDIPPKDPKSELQEKLQSFGYKLPKYRIKAIEGPSHEPLIEVELQTEQFKVSAQGSSKKEAEKQAAIKMLDKIKS